MLQTPMDVLHQFPVRKSKEQKQAFREAVCDYAARLGYPAAVEQGSFGSRNVVIGDPEAAKILITAHYDTCARLPIPNLLTPCNFWVFALWQLLLTLILLLPPLAVGFFLALVTGSSAWIGPSVYLGVWVMIGLMLFGPANPSNHNDNTSGVVTVLEILTTMQENQRSSVCFVLFDLEEAGMIGSASYRKAHKKATDSQLVLNLDCVGDGDHLRMFPTKAVKKDRKLCTGLYCACGYFGPKELLVQEKGFGIYPSDQAVFPYGVGICALRQSRWGLYLGRIHTPQDTCLDQTNVNILRAALITYLGRTAAK